MDGSEGNSKAADAAKHGAAKAALSSPALEDPQDPRALPEAKAGPFFIAIDQDIKGRSSSKNIFSASDRRDGLAVAVDELDREIKGVVVNWSMNAHGRSPV